VHDFVPSGFRFKKVRAKSSINVAPKKSKIHILLKHTLQSESELQSEIDNDEGFE